MSHRAIKPTLREQIGSAVNTSALTLHARRESPLERIAGLGAAAYRVSIGADRRGLTAAAAAVDVHRRAASMRALMLQPGDQPDERDRLAAELGQVLLHLREGGQDNLRPTAARLFGEWITSRRLFTELAGAEHEALRLAFARRAIDEWLDARCLACRGSGKQERSSTGRWLTPRGSMQRNAMFRPCTACHGTGRASSRPPERMRLLGLTREDYDAGRWDQRFNAAQGWLQKMLPLRLIKALTTELERRTRRT